MAEMYLLPGLWRTCIRKVDIACTYSHLNDDAIMIALVANTDGLTEQDDDADEDRDDGAGAETGGRNGSGGAAVPVVVAGTDFDPDHGAVGQRRVP